MGKKVLNALWICLQVKLLVAALPHLLPLYQTCHIHPLYLTCQIHPLTQPYCTVGLAFKGSPM